MTVVALSAAATASAGGRRRDGCITDSTATSPRGGIAAVDQGPGRASFQLGGIVPSAAALLGVRRKLYRRRRRRRRFCHQSSQSRRTFASACHCRTDRTDSVRGTLRSESRRRSDAAACSEAGWRSPVSVDCRAADQRRVVATVSAGQCSCPSGAAAALRRLRNSPFLQSDRRVSASRLQCVAPSVFPDASSGASIVNVDRRHIRFLAEPSHHAGANTTRFPPQARPPMPRAAAPRRLPPRPRAANIRASQTSSPSTG